MRWMQWTKDIGPASLVAAAFIGPGTVTLCTLAGAGHGFDLLWAMVFSIFSTLILQEMAARLGLVAQAGLAAVVKNELRTPAIRVAMLMLIISAVAIGNMAYEAGNISGSMLGLAIFIPNPAIGSGSLSVNYLTLLIGIVAFLLLYSGNYRLLEKVLMFTVVVMSVAFIITAILTRPSLSGILSGMFSPSVSNDNLLMVVSLVGTTVVPYNIFLHSSLISQRWKHTSDLSKIRMDTVISILVGGVVSFSIIVCAANLQGQSIANATDLAVSLKPLLGAGATYFMAVGLFAAGLSSAITAPLAAALVVSECLGWKKSLSSRPFRITWMSILLPGVCFASLGIRPIQLIQFAQLVNGILLPIATGMLLWAINQPKVIRKLGNSKLQNVIGIGVFIVTLFLGGKSIVLLLL